MAIQGQDWASYQSATPSTAGLAFTFIKATEGTGYVSPRMAAQTAHARAAGLVVGFYHFLRPGSMIAQAAYFVAKAASQDGDILAADWEDSGVSCAAKDQFIREVKRLRPTHRVVLYCNTSYWKSRDTTSYAGDGLWIADPNHPSGSPGISADWLFQQYSSAGGVDRNVANSKHFKTVADLRAWAGGTTPEEENPMAGITKADIYDAVWKTDKAPAPKTSTSLKTNPTWAPVSLLSDIANNVRAIRTAEAGQTAAIAALAKLVGSGVDTAAVVAAVEAAIETAVIDVNINSKDA
ncbi:glycoside hydrolase family 25 protein [Streptomyces sp. NRRL S-1824]|uniref:glycoside hydrolase family 25 protein n=1 Tax=Streptomyces sp. NRRL S-1824 TaxID=1463889 RepID=UPI0004C723D4|nr:GH25 family lysozyme [Streptomyces sp. NRRL S-1824]